MSAFNYGRRIFLKTVGAGTASLALSHLTSCNRAGASREKFSRADTTYYNEKYRPQFHFTPEKNWMNDPNGLVYYKGEYHLFFQHNPRGIKWGNMTWGHAVSGDLVHWKQLQNAIEPYDGGDIWSGSAVVDHANISGLAPTGGSALVAAFTHARAPFGQAIAYSTDSGRSWTLFNEGAHVVPNQGISKDERDPRIFWHAPSDRWIMALWVSHGHVRFFSSADLKTWLHTSDFHIDGFYECPDVLELPLDGGPRTRWIIYDAAGNYSVGRFDGIRFEADQRPRKADFGANFYAAQTWTNTPGRCLQIAWMRDGSYPGMPFNQQMSFPCELKLRTFPDGLRICRLPVREIENIHGKNHKWKNKILAPGENLLSGITGELFDIRAEFEISDSAEFGIKVRGEAINYNAQGQKIYCLGKVASLTPAAKRIKLHILVDRTSIEIFGNEGMISMTSCFLPKDEGKVLELYNTGGGTVKIVSLHVYELRSIWTDTKA